MIDHMTIFEDLSDDEQAWLYSAGQSRNMAAGDLVIEEGTEPCALFIVLEGRLSVRVKAVGDKPIAYVRPGELVGEMSFMEGRPASATVEVEDDARLLILKPEPLSEKLEKDMSFAVRFYKSLSLMAYRRLRKTVEKLSLVIHGMSDESTGDEGTDWTDLYLALEECKALADKP